MPSVEQDVEVIGTSHAIGALDGASLTAVALGMIGKPAAVPVGSPFPPGASVAAIWAVVFVSPEMNSRYAMGSRWHLKIDEDGSISVRPVKGSARKPSGPAKRP
jgi:hypothetical protein